MKNKGKKYSEEDVKRTRVVTTLFLIMMSGVLLGTLLFRGGSNTDVYTSDLLSHGFIKLSCAQTLTDVFIRSVSWTSFLLILLFVLGFCSISQPLELMVLLWRGTALGLSVSYMYSIYEIKGAVISALMILPHAVITSVVLVFAARESLRFSDLYIMHIAGRDDENHTAPQLKLYIVRFVVLLTASLVSSFLDCALTYLFTDRLLV